MAGFIGVIDTKESIDFDVKIRTINDKCVEKKIICSNALFFVQQHSHFTDDYVFVETESFVVCFFGVIINSKELFLRYGVLTSKEFVLKYLTSDDLSILINIKGIYAGFCFNKINNTANVFNNHFSQKSIYYYINQSRGIFIFSTHIESIVDILKLKKLNFSCSDIGAYFLLTFGYMLRDETIVDGVRKMLPGYVITLNADFTLKNKEYYVFNNTTIHVMSEEELLATYFNKLDNAFKMGFQKDRDYLYNTLALLSGGLDSRLISFSAKMNGIERMTNLTFGRTYCDDVRIAQDISNYLGNKFIFVSLERGEFLLDIDENLNTNFGGIQYTSSAHTLSAIKVFNFSEYGLLHNGNVADISHGDYISFPYHTDPNPKTWANSTRLYNRISTDVNIIAQKYNNDEHFSIYNRGINGVLNGGVMYSEFTDTYEPYMYYDLVDFASKIPPNYKFNELLFLKLINKYYKDASKFDWARWNLKPSVRNINQFMQLYVRLKRKNKIILGNYKGSMNPFDEWMAQNSSLLSFFDSIFKNNVELFDHNKELKRDIINQYKIGNFSEKAQVITLLKLQERLLKI